jgi:hypothetical protein
MENMATKSFWERPEGKTGMIFLALIIGLGGYALFLALPFILSMLVTATQTAILAIGLAVVGVVISDKKFRLNVKAIYQLVMKKLTGFVIELDPIAIIENYLKTLEESLEKMGDQLNLLSGQESKLNTKILNNRDIITKSLNRAAQAKSKMSGLDEMSTQYMEYKSVAMLDANKAGRLQESNHKLEEVLSKIVNLRKILEKMNQSAKFVLADMTDEVKIKKEEREAILKGYSAFKSAMKVLDGSPDEKAMFDQSMEYMATDLGNKVGEIERFMQNSGGILTGMDLDKEMFDMKGLQMIDEWTSKGSDMFITSPKDVIKPTVTISKSTFTNASTKSKYL